VADSDAPRRDAGALSEAYERLREAVLAGGGGWRLGHGVLCARGMTAWMSVVGELSPPVGVTAGAATGAGAPASTGCQRLASPPVALRHADQIVAVLTQMVLPLAA
jgi:hypothetical protein